MKTLSERLAEYIPRGDGYNSEYAQTLTEAVDSLAAMCQWEQECEGEGTYHTDCRNSFELYDGTPAGHNFHFCCYCGGALVEKLWDEAAQEEQQ